MLLLWGNVADLIFSQKDQLQYEQRGEHKFSVDKAPQQITEGLSFISIKLGVLWTFCKNSRDTGLSLFITSLFFLVGRAALSLPASL